MIARFTVPAANTDGTKPADLDSVEVIALTGTLDDQFGQPLPPADFVRFAEVVGRVPIEPPPDPEAEGEASREAQPPAAPAAQPGVAAVKPPADPRPVQGEPAALADTLDGDKLKPWVHPEARRTKTTDDSATKTFAVPLRWPPPASCRPGRMPCTA